MYLSCISVFSFCQISEIISLNIWKCNFFLNLIVMKINVEGGGTAEVLILKSRLNGLLLSLNDPFSFYFNSLLK